MVPRAGSTELRTNVFAVRSFALSHDSHPFLDDDENFVRTPTMKKFHKNSVTKTRNLSPISLKTFENLVLKSSRRLLMTVAIEALSGIN